MDRESSLTVTIIAVYVIALAETRSLASTETKPRSELSNYTLQEMKTQLTNSTAIDDLNISSSNDSMENFQNNWGALVRKFDLDEDILSYLQLSIIQAELEEAEYANKTKGSQVSKLLHDSIGMRNFTVKPKPREISTSAPSGNLYQYRIEDVIENVKKPISNPATKLYRGLFEEDSRDSIHDDNNFRFTFEDEEYKYISSNAMTSHPISHTFVSAMILMNTLFRLLEIFYQ